MPKGTPNKILGLRLDEALIRTVKAEAASRGITASKLFEELWAKYRKS